jgi:hypothetical protein
MATDQGKIKENRQPKYDRSCYMIRSKAFKAMELPFKWQYIPLDYLQPEVYMNI